jgi:hypothetical protein
VPYVSCPACEQVTFSRPSCREPELCARCGSPLPFTRRVVSLSRYRALTEQASRDPEPEPLAA